MRESDAEILRSQLEAKENRIAELELVVQKVERDLLAARMCANRWEHEAKAVRKELQRVRMTCDTDRLTKKK
jgi:type II secretory pathway component PulJ